LGNVIGHLVPTCHPERHSVDPPLVVADDGLEGVTIASESPSDQVTVDFLDLHLVLDIGWTTQAFLSP
jgi:hypothetical protein